MNIQDVPKALMIAFMESKALELVAGYGIGKSTMVKDFAAGLTDKSFVVHNREGKRLRHRKGEPVGLVTCLVPTYSAEEIRGFPMPDYENEEMFYSVPPFFPSERTFPNGVPRFGIIFLDEYRLGHDEVVKATTQLLLEGRMGDHSLDQYGHWVVFAASNREEDGLGIGREPPIVTQRKMVINVEPNVMASLAWLEANEARLNIPPVIRFFTEKNPDLVLGMKTPDNGQPFPTPRSMCEAGQLAQRYMTLTNYKQSNKFDIPSDDSFLLELMASKVGTGAAAQLQTFSRLVGQVPDYMDIVKHPDTCTVPDAERMDACNVTIQVIAAQAGDYSRDGNTHDQEKLEKEMDSLVTYLMRLPAEFQVTGMTRTFKNCPAIYSHPKVRLIAKENPSVFRAISTPL